VANNVNVVNRGFEYITQWMALTNNNSSNGGWTVPSAIGWGGANGSNATSTVLPAAQPTTTQGTGQWFDVGPFQEFSEARTIGTASILGNSTGSGTVTTQFVGTITATSAHTALTNVATGEVAESFLAFTTTKPSAYTLNSAVTAVATAFTVTTGTLVNGYYQFDNEVVHITAVSSNTIASTVVRAQNGSSANAAASGDTITFGNIPGAGNSNPSNGDIFAHAGFVGLSLNNGDSVQFTWQINVTS
jgi:hypothetical protein